MCQNHKPSKGLFGYYGTPEEIIFFLSFFFFLEGKTVERSWVQGQRQIQKGQKHQNVPISG